MEARHRKREGVSNGNLSCVLKQKECRVSHEKRCSSTFCVTVRGNEASSLDLVREDVKIVKNVKDDNRKVCL